MAREPRKTVAKPDEGTRQLEELRHQASDLGVARKALDDAVSMTRGLWISFISLSAYLMVAVGSVTHVDLFLEKPLKLPLLLVDVPLVVFFWLAPLLYLIVHIYLLLNLKIMSDNVRAWTTRLETTLANEKDPQERDRIADQHRLNLPNFFPVQMLAAPDMNRHGSIGWVLRSSVLITVVIGPFILLGLIQLQFLPYHHEAVTWVHRLSLLGDMVAVWHFWPKINSGSISDSSTFSHRSKAVAFFAAAALSVFFLVFPGERSAIFLEAFSSLPPPNRLILSDIDFVDDENLSRALKAAKEQGAGESEIETTFSVRERNLQNAVFDRSDMRYFDFSRSNLTGASFNGARIYGWRNKCGVSLLKPNIKLVRNCQKIFKGLNLEKVNLAGVNLDFYDLSDTNLTGANLSGTSLNGAILINSDLSAVNLQNARLESANLEGANLSRANIRLAVFDQANLRGATFRDTDANGASFSGAEFPLAVFYRTRFAGANLESADFSGATFIDPDIRHSLINAETKWDYALIETANGLGGETPPQLDSAQFLATIVESIVEPGHKNLVRRSVIQRSNGYPVESVDVEGRWQEIATSAVKLPGEIRDPMWLTPEWRARMDFLANAICAEESTQRATDFFLRSIFVRGRDKNGKIFANPYLPSLARRLFDTANCPGAAGEDGFVRRESAAIKEFLADWASEPDQCEALLPNDSPQNAAFALCAQK